MGVETTDTKRETTMKTTYNVLAAVVVWVGYSVAARLAKCPGRRFALYAAADRQLAAIQKRA